MTQTSFDLPQGDSFDLTSGRMKFIRDSRIDMINCNLKFVSDLSFVIWDLKFGIYAMSF
jgi:hypothetical protein